MRCDKIAVMSNLKNMQKRHAGLVLCASLLLSACSGDGRPLMEAVEVDQLNLGSISIAAPAGFVTNPALVVSPGDKINFLVAGQSKGGQTVALPASDRRWSVVQSDLASIDGNGKFTAIADGMAKVKLNIGGFDADYDVTISSAALSAIDMINGAESMERCLPQQYNATGTFADGSTRGLFNANWTVQNSESGFVGSVDDDGSASVTAVNAGLLTLNATVGSVSQSREITVADNLLEINITPTELDISEGSTISMTARGSYMRDDKTVRPIISSDVSWSITPGANLGVAEITKNEKEISIEGLEVGNTSITVACGNVSLQKPVAVIEPGSTAAPKLVFETGTPHTVSLSEDISLQLLVSTGDEFSTANQPDSSEIEWSIVSESSRGVITLSETGFVTLNDTGSATIRAKVGEDTADIVLNIDP